MRKCLILLAAVLMAAPVGADTIYLKDKTYEGKVTKNGDKYVVELLAGGGKVEVDAKDVVYVLSTDPASGPALATSGTGEPATAPASVALANSQIDVEAITMPETMVYAIQRSLAASPPGDKTFELRKQLETWRQTIHDHKRKVGPAWLTPKDFIQARAGFVEMAKEAKDLAAKAKGKPNAKDLMVPAYLKLRQAAAGWRDPLLRNFLLALVDYNSGNVLPALTEFQTCRQMAPYMPAFLQGEAIALCDLDRATEALPPATDFLRMRPDLADAFDLLKRAMAKTPGSETHSAGFVAAKDLIGQYQEPGNSSSSAQKGINWQMPGKGWSTRDDSTLPEPPMDRLIVRQAVGVPVSPTMLLVDSAAVNGADEVFVRIDGKTIIAGTVRKPLTSAKNAFAGVALVHVTGYAFTPLGRDQGADAAKDVDATVCGIGTYAEMGASFRTAKASVHPIGETFRVSASLIPGEAATPVMTESGQLVCFLTGRTDPTAENGGDEQVIPLSDIGTLIKSATPKGGAGIGMGHGLKRTGDPTPVKGQAFVVYGIFAEKFENK